MRSGCARVKPSQSGTGTSWRTRSTWNQRSKSKRMTSNKTKIKKTKHPTLSHSFILHHGSDLQAPEGTSRVCVAGNVLKLELKRSLMHLYRTRLLYMSYCNFRLGLTVLHPTHSLPHSFMYPSVPPSPQAALWLADSPWSISVHCGMHSIVLSS